MQNYQVIMPFVRPWDSDFFMQLAREVKLRLGSQHTRIRYLTMWKAAHDNLLEMLQDDEEILFLPSILSSTVVGDEEKPRLEKIEREMWRTCGTPLKVMVDAERFRPTGSKSLEDFMWCHFKVFESIIEEDTIVMSNAVDHLCYWLACDLATMRKGSFFGFSVTGRPSQRTLVTKNAQEMWAPFEPEQEHFEEAQNQRIEVYRGTQPDYMHRTKNEISLVDILKNRYFLMQERMLGNYFITSHDFVRPAHNAVKRVKWALHRRNIHFHDIEEITERFVYLALHLEPEASTSAWSPFFKDQGFWIETVAKSLPLGIKLVVKENPKMWGERSIRFYNRATNYPEVLWIDPRTPSEQLIKKSVAVLTITGTVALEACALRKPVAIFGNPPYSTIIECIPKVDCLENLPYVLDGLINGALGVSDDVFQEQFVKYIANLIPSHFKALYHTGSARTPLSTPYKTVYADFVLAALSKDN